MNSDNAKCQKCDVDILALTSERTGGLCMKCSPQSGGDPAARLELGMRILLAVVFGVVFAGVGYTAGALIWTGVGVILAFVLFPIGALYGFFCDYINAVIRSLLSLP